MEGKNKWIGLADKGEKVGYFLCIYDNEQNWIFEPQRKLSYSFIDTHKNIHTSNHIK